MTAISANATFANPHVQTQRKREMRRERERGKWIEREGERKISGNRMKLRVRKRNV